MRVQFEIRNKRTTLYYNNYRTRKPVVDGKPTKVLCFGELTKDTNGNLWVNRWKGRDILDGIKKRTENNMEIALKHVIL